MQKFENMDVIAALEAIMHQNTAYYQSDFAYDIKMLREAARSDQPEDKLLLWLSRPSGTFCFRERDVLLKDTQAYNTWKFCGEQTHDRILAYAVELTGAANGTVQGNLYELDYQQHFQHIREVALPVGANRLIYESGMREIGPKEHFDSRPDKYFGEFVRYEMQPRDPELLQAAIRQEQRSREPARPGDFKEHLAALHTGLIEAEAQRIAADMKRLAAPNSPDKNHFMVEVSPYFTKLASSRDTDQLLAMLPYKSLHLSSVKDRFGIYALVDKNENRDKNIRKPRASVRKQLSETKQTASPKNAAESALSGRGASESTFKKSSAAAFAGSSLSCAGGAEYSSFGRIRRTLLIDGETRRTASTMRPFPSTSMMFECLPIISQCRKKRVQSRSSFKASNSTTTTLSEFG